MDRADGWIYAAYVLINLALFTIKTPEGRQSQLEIPCSHLPNKWFGPA
jgi:hypothetical protein